MQFKNTLTLAALAFIGHAAAQIVGTATLDVYSKAPSAVSCGASCVPTSGAASGQWVAVAQAFETDFPCTTQVRLTNPSNNETTVVPICDVCSSPCTGTPNTAGPFVWDAPASVFTALGTSSPATVSWNI